jgi:hypothetical protein
MDQFYAFEYLIIYKRQFGIAYFGAVPGSIAKRCRWVYPGRLMVVLSASTGPRGPSGADR